MTHGKESKSAILLSTSLALLILAAFFPHPSTAAESDAYDTTVTILQQPNNPITQRRNAVFTLLARPPGQQIQDAPQLACWLKLGSQIEMGD